VNRGVSEPRFHCKPFGAKSAIFFKCGLGTSGTERLNYRLRVLSTPYPTLVPDILCLKGIYSYTPYALSYYLNRASPRWCAPLRVQCIAHVWQYIDLVRVECYCVLECHTANEVTLLITERFLKWHPLVRVELHLDSSLVKRWGSV
jgi:hypothetical protein